MTDAREALSPRPLPTPISPTGLLVIDKPLGLTSMDVCRRIRRRLVAGGAPKRVKVGHGGTLDPLATGVLVVLIGKATRLCDVVMRGEKVYRAEVDLSAFTATDDREGARVEVAVAAPPTEADVRGVLAEFVGEIQQRPPAFSAIKVGGRRAYALARKGDLRELPARSVSIASITLRRYGWPAAEIEVVCGKGTYIRSLARDIGVRLGTGGHLAALRRMRIGNWRIEQALELEGIAPVLRENDLLRVEGIGRERP
ncbi:hypothetical protein BH11PLA1_BH11PLA1_19630 [soil metagenome]